MLEIHVFPQIDDVEAVIGKKDDFNAGRKSSFVPICAWSLELKFLNSAACTRPSPYASGLLLGIITDISHRKRRIIGAAETVNSRNASQYMVVRLTIVWKSVEWLMVHTSKRIEMSINLCTLFNILVLNFCSYAFIHLRNKYL